MQNQTYSDRLFYCYLTRLRDESLWFFKNKLLNYHLYLKRKSFLPIANLICATERFGKYLTKKGICLFSDVIPFEDTS